MNSPFFVGSSQVMRELRDDVSLATSCDLNVMISAEQGTGGKRLARFIHRHSRLRPTPLIELQCGALSEAHITRNVDDWPDTIYLHNVDRLTAATQAILLRLANGRVLRHRRPRLLCSSRSELYDLVRSGRFSRDLFYCLNAIRLRVPPLRERRDDIPALLEYFSKRYLGMDGREGSTFHPDAMAHLVAYDWPMNVRQLRAVMAHLGRSVRSEPMVRVHHLPAEIRTAGGSTVAVAGDAEPVDDFPAVTLYPLDAGLLTTFPSERADKEPSFRILALDDSPKVFVRAAQNTDAADRVEPRLRNALACATRRAGSLATQVTNSALPRARRLNAMTRARGRQLRTAWRMLKPDALMAWAHSDQLRLPGLGDRGLVGTPLLGPSSPLRAGFREAYQQLGRQIQGGAGSKPLTRSIQPFAAGLLVGSVIVLLLGTGRTRTVPIPTTGAFREEPIAAEHVPSGNPPLAEASFAPAVVQAVTPRAPNASATLADAGMTPATARQKPAIDAAASAAVPALRTRAREASGLLEVTSNPSRALVFVDGELEGTTPLVLSRIPSGWRHVRLELPQYRPWSRDVELKANRQARVVADLVKNRPRTPTSAEHVTPISSPR